MDRQTLLAVLPAFRDESVVIEQRQTVNDIISEMIDAQIEFAPYYDRIAMFFDSDTVEGICANIYNFEKDNLHYREETEDDQTTQIPTAILVRGGDPSVGIDCKHYALFAAGVLAGINRATGKKINWEFCFASYNVLQRTPYHVFVIVKDGKDEIWIDPTPGAEGKKPVWVIYKTVKQSNMPLRRIVAGTDFGDDIGVDPGVSVPEDLQQPIQVLQYYGILTPLGEFNNELYQKYQNVATPDQWTEITNAMNVLVARSGVIGNWFDDVFKGIQHFAAGMGMQVPRAAFLGAVAVNLFGYATKLQKALSYPDIKSTLADKWERLGGTFSTLENTINSGAKKKAVLKGTDSIGEVATAASIVGSAAIIIAAIMPLITKLLAGKGATVTNDIALGANGLPVGYSTNPVMSFVESYWPILLGAAAAIGFWYYSKE